VGKMKKLIIVFLILLLLAWPVSAQHCLDAITSQDTKSFLTEIPALNSQLGTCDNTVPSPADRFLKNEIISVKLFMQDGSTQAFTLTTQDGKITKLEAVAADKPTYLAGLGECEFDTILRSGNKVGLIAHLYMQEKIVLKAAGFFRKIKFGIIKAFINPIFKRIAQEETVACSTAI
jgi:hypothetical protein